MSAVIDQASFKRNVQPVPASHQAQMDLWVKLGMSAAMAPKIRNARTANSADMALRMERIDLVHDNYVTFLRETFAELNENCPLDNTIPTAELFQMLNELKSDMRWLMQRAIDKADNR